MLGLEDRRDVCHHLFWSSGGWSIGHHWTYGLLEHWTPIGDQSFGQDRKRKKGLLSIGRHARFVFTSRPQSAKLEMAEEENV